MDCDDTDDEIREILRKRRASRGFAKRYRLALGATALTACAAVGAIAIFVVASGQNQQTQRREDEKLQLVRLVDMADMYRTEPIAADAKYLDKRFAVRTSTVVGRGDNWIGCWVSLKRPSASITSDVRQAAISNWSSAMQGPQTNVVFLFDGDAKVEKGDQFTVAATCQGIRYDEKGNPKLVFTSCRIVTK